MKLFSQFTAKVGPRHMEKILVTLHQHRYLAATVECVLACCLEGPSKAQRPMMGSTGFAAATLNYPYHYYPPLHQSTVTLKKTSACTYFVRSSTILLYLYRTLHILGTTLKQSRCCQSYSNELIQASDHGQHLASILPL